MPGQFKFLFSPLTIGKVVVPNRISFSAHLTNLAENSLPSERHVSYYAARARGGTGLIITEEQSVHPTDRAYEKSIEAFRPEVIPGFKRISQAVHEYETRIFAQLNHNGQQCNGALSRLPVWAPSSVPDPMFREAPKEMEIEDIGEVLQYFCRSAVHALEGGFDGIELQFGHSSLARQFLSPLTNLRTDEYGGDFEKRLRFPIELLKAVRETVGKDFTLGIRLCADEMAWGGLTLEDAKKIAQALEATGTIDFMDLSLSTFYNLYLVGGSMHMPLGYAVPLAAGIKEAVRMPVFATGRINDPVHAEKILAAGQADMIGMVRSQICDPNLARKAKEGRLEEIRYCVADNQNCYGRVGVNRSIGCIQNPYAGNEKEEDEGNLPQTLWKKRIIVIGGGPAGMWAAKTATLRGHDVTLYEKETLLGGQITIAMKGSGREELGVIVRNEQNQLQKLKVPVVMGRTVTQEFVLEEKPDVVIVATGSIPKKHPVPGSDGPGVFDVWQVLQGEADIGDRILFIDNDGGHQATSAVEFLAELGKKVHILTTAYYVGTDPGHHTLQAEGGKTWNFGYHRFPRNRDQRN
jgi:mycofactocin system FadH/OYE family oxidoreductase 2